MKEKKSKEVVAKDKEWSLAVRSRDGRCMWCGKTDRLAADHIFSRVQYSTRWNVDNGITLCCGCHLFRKKFEPMVWAIMVIEHKGMELIKQLLAIHSGGTK